MTTKQGTILVIDNDPDWLEILSSALKSDGLFEVVSVERRRDAIQQLQENRFDLVFVNLLLREAFSGPWLADFTMILDEISSQKGRAIMFTGVNNEDFEIMNTIFDLRRQYKEILIVLPKHNISTYKIREEAMRALGIADPHSSGLATPPRVGVVLDEVSASMFSSKKSLSFTGVRQNNIVQDIFSTLGDNFPRRGFLKSHEDKIQMLVEAREDRKIYSSVSLWNALWLDEPGLPNIPLMKVLAKQEFSGGMYETYRDHVSHSIWMYFLGLYLYLQNTPVGNAIRKKMTEDTFLKAWKIASIFHDIGYAGDKGIDHEDDYLKPLLEDLRKFNEFPMGEYLTARGIKCSEADEEAIARVIGLFTPKVLTLDDLEKLPIPGKNENILNFIEDFAVPTQLAQRNQTTPFQNYYSLCKTVKPKNRERFRDHGILSALILLHQFYYFDYCLKSLKNISLPERLSRETRSALEKIITEPITSSYEESIKQAAAAMALHNVNVDIWNIEKAKDSPYNLSLSDYKITLDDTPLAFLLALTDVLQCWDRPMRRYVDNPKKLSLRSQDVSIRCENDTIVWSIKDDSTSGEKLVKPNQEIQVMSTYLSYGRDGNLNALIREEDWIE